jgi:redox-sensitive bicupin YhaK (pirin superfamily)
MASPVLEAAPLGAPPWVTLDPFLFCVHHDDAYPAGNEKLGPAASLAGRDLGQDFAGKDGWRMYHGRTVPGFPAHPHRGFETVTIARRGLVDHSDSLGAAARFGRGDAQWLTAGSGIVHAEMFPLLNGSGPNHTEFFQLWLNLPPSDKMAEPAFRIFWADEIPLVRSGSPGSAAEVLVVAGELDGARPPAPPPRSWAARDDTDVAIWTIHLDAGARRVLPAARRLDAMRVLYFFQGSALRVGSHLQPKRAAMVLDPGQSVELEAVKGPVEALVLQGRPIRAPVAQHGPFVMNTRAELVRAFSDYERTRFGGWPWPSDDPVHGHEATRFARFPSGERQERR